MFKIENIENFKTSVLNAATTISSETFGWLAILVMHAATIPSLLAVMSGHTDVMPQVDLVLMLWSGLLLFFIKAAVQKDMLNLITIGLGFFVQAVLMALIFFR
jgi:hypothetical protein